MGKKPCCDRTKVKTGPWSPEEDMKLIICVQRYGHSNWRAVPAVAGLERCGKSCRMRWVNYLRPDVNRSKFTKREEDMILLLHSILGNKWAKIAAFLPGRTDNDVKNHWNTDMRKKYFPKKPRKGFSNEYPQQTDAEIASPQMGSNLAGTLISQGPMRRPRGAKPEGRYSTASSSINTGLSASTNNESPTTMLPQNDPQQLQADMEDDALGDIDIDISDYIPAGGINDDNGCDFIIPADPPQAPTLNVSVGTNLVNVTTDADPVNVTMGSNTTANQDQDNATDQLMQSHDIHGPTSNTSQVEYVGDMSLDLDFEIPPEFEDPNFWEEMLDNIDFDDDQNQDVAEVNQSVVDDSNLNENPPEEVVAGEGINCSEWLKNLEKEIGLDGEDADDSIMNAVDVPELPELDMADFWNFSPTWPSSPKNSDF